MKESFKAALQSLLDKSSLTPLNKRRAAQAILKAAQIKKLVREIQARQNIAAPNQASGNDTLDSANDVIAGVACLAVGYSMELRYDDQTMKTVMSADENDITKEIEELIENS